MRAVYIVIGWAIIALGLTHIAATPRYFADLTSRAVWFVSGGLALALAGAMNLANQAYGTAARGLRRLTFGSNIVMGVFAAFAGAVDRATVSQFALVVGLFVIASILSCTRAALKSAGPKAV